MVTVQELAAKYPQLWHMADSRNLSGILKRGLMATSSLLDLLDVEDARRHAYERDRRPDDVVLQSAEHGVVVLRDQRPLSIARLQKSLTTGSVADFLAFINGRVFFWPTIERLKTMNGAKAYREREQLVFVVKTASLLRAHQTALRLSRINSGATMPYAVARSIDSFQRPEDYDWNAGKRHVAEITIKAGVPDIWHHVERLELWQNKELRFSSPPPFDETLLKRLAAPI